MSRKTVPVFFIIFCLSLLSCGEGIVVVSYNVENLFDDRVDGREYPEYRGENWNPELYRRKLAVVARAVKAVSVRGPDILCLQEIESRAALRELRDRHLKGRGYRYLVFVPQEGVATTVACLSRLPVVHTYVYGVGSFDGIPLRHILEIQVEHEGSILYLFNSHWKSKTGGVEHTAEARRRAAEVLAERVRKILQTAPEADLLIVGDLNENLEEYDLAGNRYPTGTVPFGSLEAGGRRPGQLRYSGSEELNALFLTAIQEQAGLRQDRVVMYEPWYEIPTEQRGSCVYQGQWQTPDRILLSAGLFDEEGFTYSPRSFGVVKAGFLLDPDSGFPRRWRPNGRGAESGTSDHLPLRLTITPR
ncbi:MAG: endonuclease/exonuclease/phosphatase family protein [Spirochaetaceae bacterium]|nr:MAG: endonuclease/exonuclease/phosphatase family protein [Spirochaetaceae bacterium]